MDEKEKISFQVTENKFWILEQRLDKGEPSKPAESKKEEQAQKNKKRSTDADNAPKPEENKEEKYNVNAWVFNDEMSAIKKFKGLITADKELTTPEGKVDLSKIEKMGDIYQLQEVEIAKDKYNIKAISWLKVALLGFVDK